MKVKDLVEKLLKEDQDRDVFTVSEHGEWTSIRYVIKGEEEYENCVILGEYNFIP